jgi:hypothetical protein
MNHLSDDQLALLNCGAGPRPADDFDNGLEDDEHLHQCVECRERYDSLRRILSAVEMPAPERGREYGREVWKRIESRIDERHPRRFARWAIPVAAAVVLAAGGAFEAGRLYQTKHQPPPTDSGGAERILLVAVGDYLERSQIVLIELANADPNEPLDISVDQTRARDLVAENRLYRQTAERTGQAGIASLLEELERVLLEIEHAPSTIAPEELRQLRHRLRDDGILFKMRVTGANVGTL